MTPEEILAYNLEQSIKTFSVLVKALREGRLTIESGNFDLRYMYDREYQSFPANADDTVVVIGVDVTSNLKLRRV